MAEGVSRSDATTEHGQSKSPVAEGIIERYVLDSRGEIEGLLLADGSHRYVTSRAGKDLLRVLTPGDRVRVYALRGIVQGMVLSDETQIRLPPHTTEELRRSLHVVDSVTVRGTGTTNQFGRAIEALAIGRDMGSLVPLDASPRSLP